MPDTTTTTTTTPPNSTSTATASTKKPLRILIADDQAFFRRGIREVLNDEEDMQVVAEATDGEQAVRVARELRPSGLDLVLMDIDMPRLDGIAAATLLDAEDPDLPVVMLTISTLDSHLFEAVRAGAVGFLSKSLAPDALVRTLRGFARGESLPMAPLTAQKLFDGFRRDGLAADGPHLEPTDVALTPRENEVLERIARGSRDREIAEQLTVTQSTVKKHVQNILRKLHARNRAEAVARLREPSPNHQP
jgi:DNA-binding NarL/FixJ family response regulator